MLSKLCDELFVVKECNTVFPGEIQDFYTKSDIMREYFSNVLIAEKKVFGELSFPTGNIKSLSIKSNDLNLLTREQLSQCLNSDIYIIFGASFIKGWLVDFLVEHMAINIHMGISPYYRGSSCNFWAMYDGNPGLVGATILRLSKGLDSGPILYHALPKQFVNDPFEFTMSAVKAAHISLADKIHSNTLFELSPKQQDKKLEIRYSRNIDFNDNVAFEFLSAKTHNHYPINLKNNHWLHRLIQPFILD